ncbi:MAG: hypothetical protein V1837_03385 [Candidatus Woesearchaeota archaeon]
MNKRGQLIETGAIILIILTTLGIGVTAYFNAGPFWVGDSSTHIYYDYQKCPQLFSKVNKENIVIFKSLQDAYSNGFNLSTECK